MPRPLSSRARCKAVLLFLCGLACVVLLRRSAIDYYCVAGESMEPTLLNGDCIVVPKGLFGPRSAAEQRGAVVVLRLAPQRSAYIVKRVIARAGDTVEVRSGRFFLNGALSPEASPTSGHSAEGLEPPGDWHFAYLVPEAQNAAYHPTPFRWGPIVVPDSSLFVLGDNPDQSGDSRDFGFVRPDEVVGTSPLIFFSSERRPSPPFRGFPSLRFSRMGKRIE